MKTSLDEYYNLSGNEYPITHFPLFSDCDPTSFESVVEAEKLIKAMDGLKQDHRTWYGR